MNLTHSAIIFSKIYFCQEVNAVNCLQFFFSTNLFTYITVATWELIKLDSHLFWIINIWNGRFQFCYHFLLQYCSLYMSITSVVCANRVLNSFVFCLSSSSSTQIIQVSSVYATKVKATVPSFGEYVLQNMALQPDKTNFNKQLLSWSLFGLCFCLVFSFLFFSKSPTFCVLISVCSRRHDWPDSPFTLCSLSHQQLRHSSQWQLSLVFSSPPCQIILSCLCAHHCISVGLSPTTTFRSFSVSSDFSWCSCFLSLVFALLLDSFDCFMCQSFFYSGPNKIYSECVRISWLWTQWRLSPLNRRLLHKVPY